MAGCERPSIQFPQGGQSDGYIQKTLTYKDVELMGEI